MHNLLQDSLGEKISGPLRDLLLEMLPIAKAPFQARAPPDASNEDPINACTPQSHDANVEATQQIGSSADDGEVWLVPFIYCDRLRMMMMY